MSVLWKYGLNANLNCSAISRDHRREDRAGNSIKGGGKAEKAIGRQNQRTDGHVIERD